MERTLPLARAERRRSADHTDNTADTGLDVITPETARTLAGLFRERVRRSPIAVAYRYFNSDRNAWQDVTWTDMAIQVARWQAGLEREMLEPGDRVAVMLRNCCDWVTFDQAAHGLGLVVVPLYADDSPENVAYILRDAGVKLLLIEGHEQWQRLRTHPLNTVRRILSVQALENEGHDSRVTAVVRWAPDAGDNKLREHDGSPETLATIVYTSGTTGSPKGVMLSHRNILWNAYSSLRSIPAYPHDLFLSFLPLSHSFERTVGYYFPMMAGATVAYARSVALLAEDLLSVRPTVLISVPRIYERVCRKVETQLEAKPPLARKLFTLAVDVGWSRFEYRQGRGSWHPTHLLWPLLDRLVASKVMARLGGRVRVAICGGAPLPFAVARTFIGLGLPVLQGYGLTEASPVLSVNRWDDNDPASVGPPLEEVELRLGKHDELLAKSPGVMLGYWNNPQASAATVDEEGWLHTGDQARIEDGRIYITGRLKEIIVLANGEKVPPADMEMAIMGDPLFEQIMVIGDNRPYLAALLVLNRERWQPLANALGLAPDTRASLRDERACAAVLERVNPRLERFPGYARIRRIALLDEPWTAVDGLLTPTLKLRRDRILKHHAAEVSELYQGHE